MNELKPREKALKYGIEVLENHELLSLILKTGINGKSVTDISKEITSTFNDLSDLFSYTYEELIQIEGIGQVKALEILAIIEIYKRLNNLDDIERIELLSSDKVANWIRYKIGFSYQEEFYVLFLDGAGNLIRHEVLFKGSSKNTVVGIDEIIRRALLLKASAIIVAHNHPGGNAKPSDNDLITTEKLLKSCQLLGIKLLDHIIVTKSSYYSFSLEGLLC